MPNPPVLAILLLLAAPVLLAAPALPAGTAAAADKNAKAPPVIPADVTAIKRALDQARAQPGTRAVLVNVWATWCEPCREEMPDLLKLTRDPKARGVRLLLISADPLDSKAEVASYLGSLGMQQPSYLKTGDDMAFINGLDPTWDGTLPTSWLFAGGDQRAPVQVWNGKVSYQELMQKIASLSPQKKPPEAPQSQGPRRNP